MALIQSPEARRLPNSAAAGDLFAALADEQVEVMAFAYLGERQTLLGIRHSRSSSAEVMDVPIRDVAADALSFGAASVVMAHNHPSGDPTPSNADREATRQLARTLEALGVRLIDHLVIARGGMTSFRAMGLL